MRLGAPLFGEIRDAQGVVSAAASKKYRAVYCPAYIKSADQHSEIDELRHALSEADIVLSEVGTWVNPLSPDPNEAQAARRYLIDRLRLADLLHARCCVNILGSRSPKKWYAPHPDNFTQTFFDDCVALYQGIIDEVNPTHTTLAFEVMPFCLLDSAEGYRRFLEAIDRPRAAVHLDPVNLLNSPRTLYNHAALFEEAFQLLGGRVVSVHVKDITLDPEPVNTKMDEVRLGLGDVDLALMLRLCSQLNDVPLMLEHLPDEQDYDLAAAHLRQVAAQCGMQL